MGALEHSSNVIWHAASAQSLGAKILCTFGKCTQISVTFKDYAYRQIMLMMRF